MRALAVLVCLMASSLAFSDFIPIQVIDKSLSSPPLVVQVPNRPVEPLTRNETQEAENLLRRISEKYKTSNNNQDNLKHLAVENMLLLLPLFAELEDFVRNFLLAAKARQLDGVLLVQLDQRDRELVAAWNVSTLSAPQLSVDPSKPIAEQQQRAAVLSRFIFDVLMRRFDVAVAEPTLLPWNNAHRLLRPGVQLRCRCSLLHGEYEMTRGLIVARSTPATAAFFRMLAARLEEPGNDPDATFDRLLRGPFRSLISVECLQERELVVGWPYFVDPQAAKMTDSWVMLRPLQFPDLPSRRHMMREQLAWMVDLNAYYANNYRMMTYGAMDRRVQSLDEQTSELLAALSIAHALKRLLVLPRLSTFDRFGTPFFCSAELLYDLSEWDTKSLRENSFLYNPLLVDMPVSPLGSTHVFDIAAEGVTPIQSAEQALPDFYAKSVRLQRLKILEPSGPLLTEDELVDEMQYFNHVELLVFPSLFKRFAGLNDNSVTERLAAKLKLRPFFGEYL